MQTEAQDWRDLAKCRGMDPNVFFPGKDDVMGMRRALKVCEGCLVTEPCLECAMDRCQNEDHGVWGGTSENERRRLRVQRRQRALAR